VKRDVVIVGDVCVGFGCSSLRSVSVVVSKIYPEEALRHQRLGEEANSRRGQADTASLFRGVGLIGAGVLSVDAVSPDPGTKGETRWRPGVLVRARVMLETRERNSMNEGQDSAGRGLVGRVRTQECFKRGRPAP
jgi:hypothetical protein